MAGGIIKTDISNMPELEFKTTIIIILARLQKSIEETRETLTPEINDLTTNQSKIKNAVTEIQKQLNVITTWMEEVEE